MPLSHDAEMIGRFILLKAFSTTLTADSESVGDACQVFRDTVMDSVCDIDPSEFPSDVAASIRQDVKDYITSFLDGVSSDVTTMTNRIMITETFPHRSVS